MLCVGLAVEEPVASTLGPEGIVFASVGARMLKVRLVIRHGVTTIFVVWYAPTETAPASRKTKFWKTLGNPIAEVSTNEIPDTYDGRQCSNGKERRRRPGWRPASGRVWQDTRSDGG